MGAVTNVLLEARPLSGPAPPDSGWLQGRGGRSVRRNLQVCDSSLYRIVGAQKAEEGWENCFGDEDGSRIECVTGGGELRNREQAGQS